MYSEKANERESGVRKEEHNVSLYGRRNRSFLVVLSRFVRISVANVYVYCMFNHIHNHTDIPTPTLTHTHTYIHKEHAIFI